jgi:hypothetical protein
MTDETTPESAPAATTPPPTATRSPWPILIPVIAGVSALLLGGFIGGAIGYSVGDRPGPVMLDQQPHPRLDGPGDGDRGNGTGPFDFDRSIFATGTISSVGDDEIVVELENGITITYVLDDNTDVVEVNVATVDDLAAGDQVTVLADPRNGEPTARIIRTGDGLLPLDD